MRKSVFGILVVAVTVTILLAGSTAVTADHAPIEEDHNQTPYGMSNADFAQLWSYVEPYENSTLDNMEFESASTEYALGSDWSTTQPRTRQIHGIKQYPGFRKRRIFKECVSAARQPRR